MKKYLYLIPAMWFTVLSTLGFTPPDEGMWLPMFVDRLNYTDMEQMGLQLTAEEIYSINNSSLKDAIVGLSTSSSPRGYFCTGEIVSDQGLMFTNHHCGYDIIQQHSSVEHNYLKDGFWARSFEEELKNEALSASFLVRMDDVTDSILPELTDDMSERERNAKIRELSRQLEKTASENGKYHVRINGFYEGNEYYRFVYLVYPDVRLVGAPPSYIGNYGGNTDNWMWPRHTGDFSIFRVYSGPDGSPAPYSEQNIPLKPKHHLPISIAGVKKDDFAMIWGYPGGTNRYMTSYGVAYNQEVYSPTLVELFGKQLEILKEDMDADPRVNIQYASHYALYANYWKNLIGQMKGIKNLTVIEKKRAIEDDFLAWVNAEEARKEKYGNVLTDIEMGYKQQAAATRFYYYLIYGLMEPDILDFAREFYPLEEQLLNAKEDPETPERSVEILKAFADEHFKDYNASTDQKLMAGLYAMFDEEIEIAEQPDFFKDLKQKFKGNFEEMADEMFEKSMFGDRDKILAFLENPNAKKLAKDPVYVLASQVSDAIGNVAGPLRTARTFTTTGDRLFIAGLREMHPGKVFYPDANSTMRLSYGSVQDYYPADAIHYNYITYLSGVMEKEDPTNEEFIVPGRLKELYEQKDFGRYGTRDGRMVVGFLTTNDITGGNSGSPVINGDGELIGLAFDGNWEAMSGDIVFEPELQRTICVDSRYVLFIIDKFAGATNLIDELTIVQ
jgi:hypothetical protein